MCCAALWGSLGIANRLQLAAEVEQIPGELRVVDAGRALDRAAGLDDRASVLPERTPAVRAYLVVASDDRETAELFHASTVSDQPATAMGGDPEPGCGLAASRRSRSAQSGASSARIASLARHHWQIASMTATWMTIR